MKNRALVPSRVAPSAENKDKGKIYARGGNFVDDKTLAPKERMRIQVSPDVTSDEEEQIKMTKEETENRR